MFKHPLWSAEALKIKFRYGQRYTEPPEVTQKTLSSSQRGLILGDLHFENLVATDGRIVFVDFTEVTWGEVAFDMAWLWLEWWLAQGLHYGDDGFLDGFRKNWGDFVGPESLLCEMTREWVLRVFPWLLFAFARFRLGLDLSQAKRYGEMAGRLRRKATKEWNDLDDLGVFVGPNVY